MASMPAAWPGRASLILKAGAADPSAGTVKAPLPGWGSRRRTLPTACQVRPAAVGDRRRRAGGREPAPISLGPGSGGGKLSRLPGASCHDLARNQVVFLSPGWGRECRCQPGAGWLLMRPDISGAKRTRQWPTARATAPWASHEPRAPGWWLGSCPLAPVGQSTAMVRLVSSVRFRQGALESGTWRR